MNFHSHFSDDSAQNLANTFEHMKCFIYWMYENNLFTKDGIIYDTKDGRSKQYGCENSMWLSYILEFIYKVIIDRCINAPGHGITQIDGINGSKNTYLKQKICIIGTT